MKRKSLVASIKEKTFLFSHLTFLYNVFFLQVSWRHTFFYHKKCEKQVLTLFLLEMQHWQVVFKDNKMQGCQVAFQSCQIAWVFPYLPKSAGKSVSDMSLRPRTVKFRRCTKPSGNLATERKTLVNHLKSEIETENNINKSFDTRYWNKNDIMFWRNSWH